MRHGVPRLYLPGPLRNYRQHTPLALSALLVCLFGFDLASQIKTVWQLSRAPLTAEVSPPAVSATGSSDPSRLDAVFGTPPALQSSATTSAAGVTLHGSFVHADPGRSSAIIQIDGQPPQLVWQGQELQSGVVLRGVHPDHVQLMRDGQIERLDFPAVRSPVFVPDEAPQPYETEDAGDEEMQKQMEALRQQLENAVSPPASPTPNVPTKEDD